MSPGMRLSFGLARSRIVLRASVRVSLLHGCLLVFATLAPCQISGSLGNGFSAAASARGGAIATAFDSPIDAVEGNPAGLTSIPAPTLDVSLFGLVALGSFRNAANPEAKLRGIAGAFPSGAYAGAVRDSRWTVSAGVTPEILMRANWHYVDAPGTDGVSYGYQTQETQIIAFRTSIGAAHPLGARWSAGATVGVVYNQNDLHAPYIFQEQPELAGLKVLLGLKTHGYGWNGGAGLQWRPAKGIRTGLAWKSGTSIRTQGSASGSASALFNALGIAADPHFAYHVQVENHLPQAVSVGLSWRPKRRATCFFEGDLTGWHKAFDKLPIALTRGDNSTINSVAGSDSIKDAVPLHWHNQGTFHGGVEIAAGEQWTIRGGYSYATSVVPNATLIPLTAAIMQHSIATGAGWSKGRWRCDAAYQAQLPASRTIVKSGLLAGEYNNSSVRLWTQSILLSSQIRF